MVVVEVVFSRQSGRDVGPTMRLPENTSPSQLHDFAWTGNASSQNISCLAAIRFEAFTLGSLGSKRVII